MSQFLKNHPKLAIAFHGAAENIRNRRNLSKDSAVFGAVVGMHASLALSAGAALGAVLFPYVAIAAVSVAAAAIVTDGAIGAYKALAAEKVRKGLPPSRLTRAIRAFNAACDQRLDKFFTDHPGLASATSTAGATTAFAAIGTAPLAMSPCAAISAIKALRAARRNHRATL
jgi:hypothetical protein